MTILPISNLLSLSISSITTLKSIEINKPNSKRSVINNSSKKESSTKTKSMSSAPNLVLSSLTLFKKEAKSKTLPKTCVLYTATPNKIWSTLI